MTDQANYSTKLRNSHILVIGGTSGIGYAVAEASAEHGSYVSISSSDQQRVDKSIKSLKASYPSARDRIAGYICNLGDESSVEDNILRLFEQTGKLDHIVFTAGNSVPPTPIAEVDLAKLRTASTVRFTALVFVAKHAPKYLNPGFNSSITLTTGVVVEKPIPNFSIIAGSRAAVVGLGKNLALDLRPTRVNVVAVGAVDTDAWSHLSAETKEEVFNSLVSRSTTGRIADAADVAEAYIYCIKDRNVTGSVISTNGGNLLVG